VCGGVECVEAAEAFLESVISVEREAVDTFCRFRGGAIVLKAVVDSKLKLIVLSG
jgi:hypothetical protein